MTDIVFSEANIPAHLDVEEYIRSKQNGQITFTIRLNNGSVVDWNRLDVIDVKNKYFGNGRVAEFRVSIKRTPQK